MNSFDNDNKWSITSYLRKEIFTRKLGSPLGVFLLIAIALISGYLVSTELFFLPALAGIAVIAIIVIYFCFFKPLIGFYLIIAASFFYFIAIVLLQRSLPLSTGIELLILFVFLSILLHSKTQEAEGLKLLKSGITIALLFNVALIVIQAFNPNVSNLAGWVPGIKRVMATLLIYIIAYKLIDTSEKFVFFVKFWIVLSFIAALYGCYQQVFGYNSFEMAYINSQPGAYALLFQGGQLRKSSFLVDVPTFGILSGAMAVMTLLLGINEKNRKKKYILFFMAIVMELGMAFSGTRTCNIMMPCGLMLYGIITIQNKTTVIALFLSSILILFVLFAPIYSNPTLNRFRTTFNSNDESLNLRDRNRHYIQPYIYAHPLGGGLSTTGKEGLNYYPDHPLADFPPDSGLLKVALELGWVGLLVNIFLYLMIFYQGIYYYFRMRSEYYKKYVVIILATLFSIIVTMYSQMSIGQFPTVIFIFSCLSLLKRLMEFDENAVKNG